jgi:hypothetical protein
MADPGRGKITVSQGSESYLLQKAKQERGVVGWLFGSGPEKTGNIAGFAILFSFVAIAFVLLFMPDSTAFTRKDAFLSFSGVITLSLGYLFGKSTS